MMSLPSVLVGITWLLLTVLFQIVDANEKSVLCYVCSWSPQENRTDEWCTKDNFQPHMAKQMQCSQGCEYVSTYDNNNDLELFHRNCYTANKTIMEGCTHHTLPNYHKEECFCADDLCNSTPTLLQGFMRYVAFVIPMCAFLPSYLRHTGWKLI